jgi:hypothetical protein
VEGWVTFEVPKASSHVWADYKNYNGDVIFSVQLF